MIRWVIAVLLYAFCLSSSYGQAKADRQVLIQGRVLDSVEKKPVSAATITVYQKSNRKILKYGFTNNSGVFSLPDVPVADSAFLLQISHLSYTTTELDAKLLPEKTDIRVGDIAMGMQATTIEEVKVNRPPIVMNRDTLEINPEAFELQPNAVVEDLLKKVPGIVIWGDGAITVNGKKVARVLVEGKPFFGNDPAIATRNLPSEAIGKVKVYDSPNNQPHEEEKLEMDITLKSAKKNGFFGKVGASGGTKGHREGVLLLNYFDPKNQISLFGGANNTNKVARNITDFLAANVYKPGGENLDSNTPLFDQNGVNDFFVAGSRYQRTWNERLNTTLELLHHNKDSETLNKVQEMRSFEDGRQQHLAETRQNNNHENRQSYHGNARYRDKRQDLRINSGIQRLKTTRNQLYDRQVTDETGLQLSHVDKDIRNAEQDRTGNLEFAYRLKDANLQELLKFSYKLKSGNRDLEQQEFISFSDEGDDSPDQIDRMKQNNQRSDRHELDNEIGLNRLLTRAIGRPIGWNFRLSNQLIVNQMKESQQDLFFDPLTNAYTIENQSISYTDRLKEVAWTPAVAISRGIIKSAGQKRNSWQFTSKLGMETSSRKNNSDHELRVLDQNFLFVLPSANLRFEQSSQLSNRSLIFGYETLINHPQLYQLISLIDTTQKDFNRIGNRQLKPEERYQFSLEYRSTRPINSTSHQLRVVYTLRNNQFADSSMYLPSGERLTQTVNTAGLPFFRSHYWYRTARKVWGKPLNVDLMAQLNGEQRYFYNNGMQYKNRQVNSSVRTQVNYVMNDYLDIGLRGGLGMIWNANDTRRTQSNSQSLGFDTVLKWPRRITFINRFAATRRHVTGVPTDLQYLWNMEVYYRMLKKENLEIKLSAYDILKNNRTIQNILTDNTVRQMTVNNIQQFFMIGLSYYPRIF